MIARAVRWGGAGAVAIAGLALTAMLAGHAVERRATADLAALGLAHDTLRVDPIAGTLVVNGVASRDGRVRIGQVRLVVPPLLPLVPRAFAQDDRITLESVQFTLGTADVSIPAMTIVGAGRPREGVAAIFRPGPSASVAERFRTLSAARIHIPEIITTATGSRTIDVGRYIGVIAEQMREGRAARVRIGEYRQSITPRTDRGSGGGNAALASFATARDWTMDGFDLGVLARFTSETAGTAPGQFERLYDSYTTGPYTAEIGSPPDTRITIGAMRGGLLDVRPMKRLPGFAISDLEASLDEDADEDLRRRGLVALVDVATAVRSGDWDVREIAIALPDNASLRLDRLSAVADHAADRHDLTLAGLRFKADGADVRLDELALTRVALARVFEALAVTDGAFDGIAADPRQVIPEIGQIRLIGLQIDAPNLGLADERLKVGLAGAVINMGNHIRAIPTDWQIRIDNLSVAVPPDTTDSGFLELKAMGYDRVDLSLAAQQGWNERDERLTIDGMALSGVDMGEIAVSGRFVNVPRALFEGDAATAAIAALGAGAAEATLSLTDGGLSERLFRRFAEGSNRTAADLRQETATIAGFSLPAFMGGHPDAPAVGAAAKGFLSAARQTVTFRLNAAGEPLSAADFMAIGNPLALLARVRIAVIGPR